MRVAILGQAAFGAAVLERLRADGIDVVAVSAPQPAPGARADALWVAGQEAGLPLLDTAALKTEAGLGHWRSFAPDLGVMAFVTEILPPEALAAPRLGTIQYHPSLLPLHRGSSAINWPIIFGASETGLTIFWPDEGIDTGPVLLQKRCEIGPDDTVGSVYFERLFPMGVDALSEAVALVEAGKASRIVQDHRLATYEPPCSERHAQIPWHYPADRVYALIRGCNPQPGAWTTFAGEKLSIFDCRLLGQAEAGMAGRVLRVDDDSFDVRLNGGVLRIARVQPAGARKLAAGEWGRAVGLKPGSRFR